MNANLDLWRGLTNEERKTLIQAGALMTAEVAAGYNRQAAEAEKTLHEKGVELKEPSKEFINATEAFVKQDLKTIEAQFASHYGVKAVPQKMATIVALVDKWKNKLADVNPTDGEAFRKMLWEEIYSKIDPTIYSMN
jgi:TRAP-type transport system periplasmic protein